MLITKPELYAFLIVFEFVKATAGDTSLWCDLQEIAEQNGITGHDFDLALNFMIRKRLLKPYGARYTYFLSDLAVDEITSAVKFPDKPTATFPSISDIQAVLKANGRHLLL